MATLIILGASARAAAGSALRAGFSPWCADLFADADLRRMSTAVRCPFDGYPAELVGILRSAPDASWIYTGALENHPNLIRTLSEIRPLCGNGPDVLRSARSPFFVERILRESELPTPEVRTADAELPSNQRWLRKPFAGAAGNGISFTDSRPRSKRHYFQQYIEGTSMSAVFARHAGESVLLGATEQLIGTDWLNALRFRYAGNVGPIVLSTNLKRDLQVIGDVLGERCGVLGPFGVDFILRDGRPWVVEVNPRYTASVEVLEFATGIKSLATDRDVMASATNDIVGKAIWYAPRRLVIPEYEMTSSSLGVEVRFAGQSQSIVCADVPAPCEVIEQGWPVMTVFAKGRTRDECFHDLRESADRIGELLNPSSV